MACCNQIINKKNLKPYFLMLLFAVNDQCKNIEKQLSGLQNKLQQLENKLTL